MPASAASAAVPQAAYPQASTNPYPPPGMPYQQPPVQAPLQAPTQQAMQAPLQAPAPSLPLAAAQPEPAPTKKRTGLVVLLSIVAVVLVVGIALALIIGLGKTNPTPQPSAPAPTPIARTVDEHLVVLDNNDLSIIFTGASQAFEGGSDFGIKIENKTDSKLFLVLEDVQLNRSADPHAEIDAADIFAGEVHEGYLHLDSSTDMSALGTLSATLKVYDSRTLRLVGSYQVSYAY
jgi:hypothetical protein